MDTNHQLPLHKLLFILHRCLVKARMFARNGDCGLVEDLADTFEIVPLLMLDANQDALARIREILAAYQAKHADGMQDYLSILDMPEAEFESLHRAPPEAACNSMWYGMGN